MPTSLFMASHDLVRRRQHQEKSASAAHVGVVPPVFPRAICLVLSFPKLAAAHGLPGSWHSCQLHMWAWIPAPCNAQHLLSWSAWVLWQDHCATPKAQDFTATGASMFSIEVGSWNCFGDGNLGACRCLLLGSGNCSAAVATPNVA